MREKRNFITNVYMLYMYVEKDFKEINELICIDNHIKDNDYLRFVQNEKESEYDKMYAVCRELIDDLAEYFEFKIGLPSMIFISDENKSEFEKTSYLKKVKLYYEIIQKLKLEDNVNLIEYYILNNDIEFSKNSYKEFDKIDSLEKKLVEIEDNIKIVEKESKEEVKKELDKVREEIKKEENKYLNMITIFLTIFSILGITSNAIFNPSNLITLKMFLIILGAQILGITTIYTLINRVEKYTLIKICILFVVAISLMVLGFYF